MRMGSWRPGKRIIGIIEGDSVPALFIPNFAERYTGIVPRSTALEVLYPRSDQSGSGEQREGHYDQADPSVSDPEYRQTALKEGALS